MGHTVPSGVQDGYRIGDAVWSELATVASIEAEVFPEPASLTLWRSRWARRNTHLLVARREGQVAAFFGFELHGPEAHVLGNATRQEDRRRGLATMLLHAGAARARAAGARWLLGEVRASNQVQRELLQGLGWHVIGRCPHFFRNGEDADVVWFLLP